MAKDSYRSNCDCSSDPPGDQRGSSLKDFSGHPDVASGHFGSRNIHEPHSRHALEDRDEHVRCCYLLVGLRVCGFSNPLVLRELAYHLPPNPNDWAFSDEAGDLFSGSNLSVAENVIVDNRGYIYMDTLHQGLYVLRCTA